MTAYDVYLPVPAVNQLTPQTTDARPSESASLDCGEASCAAVVEYVAGVTLLPDEVHDIIWQMTGRTPETAGPTDENDLIGFLSARAGISASTHPVSSVGEAMAAIRTALFDGRPLLALRCFTSPGTTPYHWVVVTGATGPDDNHTTSVTFINPWGAVSSTQSNTDFYGWLAPDYPSAGYRLLISIDTHPRS